MCSMLSLLDTDMQNCVQVPTNMSEKTKMKNIYHIVIHMLTNMIQFTDGILPLELRSGGVLFLPKFPRKIYS